MATYTEHELAGLRMPPEERRETFLVVLDEMERVVEIIANWASQCKPVIDVQGMRAVFKAELPLLNHCVMARRNAARLRQGFERKIGRR